MHVKKVRELFSNIKKQSTTKQVPTPNLSPAQICKHIYSMISVSLFFLICGPGDTEWLLFTDGLLLGKDKDQVSVVMLLDLSAAFDNVDKRCCWNKHSCLEFAAFLSKHFYGCIGKV